MEQIGAAVRRGMVPALAAVFGAFGLALPAQADGIVVTPEGDLPFEGLFVNGVAALSVSAFRAVIPVDFRNAQRIEFDAFDVANQTISLRITFNDSYVMPATFSVPENSPWIAYGVYGQATYSGDQLLAGDILSVEFYPDSGDENGDSGAEPAIAPPDSEDTN